MLASFVARYLGQSVQAPGGLGGECVDLANLWLAARNPPLPHVYRDAVNWREAIPGLTWTANEPTNSPPPGALVVWQPTPELGIGQAGHIAVALVADANSIVSLDQNWNWRYVHFVVHSYAGVIGWQA